MQRVLRGAGATLEWTNLDQDGEPVAASGAVTAKVNRADGTEVLPAGTATENPSAGVYTVDITAAQNSLLDLLTVTWTDAGDDSTHTSHHEVVGGYYFTIAEARASDPILVDTAKYPNAEITRYRQIVEEECEFICAVAFVPRYRRVRLDGAGLQSLYIPDLYPRTIRSVRNYSDVTTYTALTADELSAIVLTTSGELWRSNGPFSYGNNNLIVDYEYGHDAPPSDLKEASLKRLRYLLTASRSGIPDRATSFSATEGGTFSLATIGRNGLEVEQPDVNTIYLRHSQRIPTVA